MLLAGSGNGSSMISNESVPWPVLSKARSCPPGASCHPRLWASREAFCGGLVTPKIDGFSILRTQPAFSLFRGCKRCACQELGLQHSQEDRVHDCMCVSGVEGNGMGMEHRIENTLSATQNLFSFLLPHPPLFPYIFVSPHLCRISGTWGSQEIASFLC